ncbi:leucine-rich repeat-containing protein [Pseudomonas fluorescens]|uniref:Leucine-rich repeat-containing protein n=1 Tax=Pseudomonas fluorescens TaxID=294 RepID=A0A379IHH3_PSEFL|nr:DUF6543 domain-containing protein [Pseudomonas fluorescens]SUD32846.1 leucine-rich repeat-containing protein [Pseudomonas fluorescens]
MPEQPSISLSDTSAPHEILQHASARWLGEASQAKRSTLASHTPSIADWYAHASDTQHTELQRLNSAAWTAQNRVDKALAGLKSPRDFGAELLQQALQRQYGVEQDVRHTYLQLYVPLQIAGFTVKPGAARTWSVPLLDAALHNFEQAETQDLAFDSDSCITTQPTASGQFAPLAAVNAKLSIPQFTRLCRQLDIGGQYKRYLDEYLDLGNPVAEASLRQWVIHSQRASLNLALYMALIKGDLPQAGYDAVHSLIQGNRSPANGCRTLECHDLLIMSTRLTGIVLFAEDLEASREVIPVIAYIPDDPYHPIKQYPSTRAFTLALTEKLRAPQYQQFFSRFIDHADLGVFFSNLTQRLTQVSWHAHTPGDPLPSWRDTAVERPNLQLRAAKIPPALFDHLYQRKLSKVFNDARNQAVSSADVDQQARWERWALLEKIGAIVLQVVAFIATPFIPPLGLLMLGYSAYQLLDDMFEGVIDWAESLTREAFGHAMSCVEQLVQLGLFASGIPIAESVLRKALPTEFWQFIDRLKPVSMPSGKTRLWRPDLTPYRHDVILPAEARPDALGLYLHQGKTLLRLGDQHYRLQKDNLSGRYSLLHPRRPQAYQPPVLTNAQGAWLTDLERPLSWDTVTLMRRLGYQTDGLSDSQLQQARIVSDTHDNALRKMHVTQQTPPPLLADTLKRFKIDQDLQDFITQMNSDDPAIYKQADPQTQLQLLTSYGLWPSTKTLRFLDSTGQSLWELSGSQGASVVQIHDAQLKNGELLHVLVESLDEADRKTLLEEPFGTPPSSSLTRAATLRKKLARIADDKRFSLFDSRYRSLEHTRNARVQKIIDAAPNRGLPTSLAEELLAGCSGAELQAIDQDQIPKRLIELAAWTQHEVRVTRASEGLYLHTVDSPDTHILALHSLENLPGWSPLVRLEVRQYRPDGPLLDAIGPEDGAIKRILVATEQGLYTPQEATQTLFGDTDFYTAILQAIPDAQRNALQIHIGQGALLRESIAEHTISRWHLRQLLDADPQYKPAYDPAIMRLRGGMEGYRASDPQPGPSQEPSLEQLAHDVYPSFSREHINDLVQTLEDRPGGARATLVSLKNEYMKLDIALALWEASTPRFYATTELPLSTREYDYARQNRAAWAQQIRRGWRQETEADNYFEPPAHNGQVLHLTMPLTGELPRLTARFEHISVLKLVGDHRPLQVDAFLRLFPRLRHLNLQNIELGRFAPYITSLPNLNELILSDCNITLTHESLLALSGLTRLVTLDLFGNPLGRIPNVENMPDLHYLDLSNTGITELPRGLLSRQHLDLVMLSTNHISELPPALFYLPANVSDKFDLSDNPISNASLEQVKTYFQRTGRHWEIDAAPQDFDQARQLYPTLNKVEINRFIFGIPGNLDAGKAALSRLADEYRSIGEDMTPWVTDRQVSRTERASRVRFMQGVEAGWRREAPLDAQSHGMAPSYHLTLAMPVSGRLPTLRTSFTHVSALTLNGNSAHLQLGQFLLAFPALKRLSIQHYTLGELPLTLASLHQLTHLSLDNCALRLTPTAINALGTMLHLERLDLNNNPLELTPDISRLTALSHISLRNTRLKEIPPSLLRPKASLTAVDLSHNAIQNIPQQAFDLPATFSAAFDLSHNPLSIPTLQQIKSYCQTTGEHWLASIPDAELQNLKHLYPTLEDAELGHIYFQLPGDLEAAAPGINQLAREWEQLQSDLQEWTQNVPEHDPLLDTVLDTGARAEEQLRRRHFKALLEQAWRREIPWDESNKTFRYPRKLVFHGQLLGDLPELNTRFETVTLLELVGDGTSQRVDGLLKGLPNLQDLTIERYVLGNLPESLFTLRRLQQLALSDNQIRLTPHSTELLSTLENLEYLDLSDNPLGATLDVRNLSRLSVLYLHNCGLSELPIGTFDLGRLRILDASDNQIQHLPSDLLEMAPPLNDDSDLSGNPLSDESLALLRRYFRQTGYELGVEEAMEDEQGSPLTPPGTPEPMEE